MKVCKNVPLLGSYANKVKSFKLTGKPTGGSSSSVRYSWGRGGWTSCPRGSRLVTTETECRRVAVVKKQAFGGVGCYLFRARGCLYNGWAVYYCNCNRHYTHWTHRPVCRTGRRKDSPVEDSPVEDAQEEDALAEDVLVEDAQEEDAPVEDAFVEETPVEEVSTETTEDDALVKDEDM